MALWHTLMTELRRVDTVKLYHNKRKKANAHSACADFVILLRSLASPFSGFVALHKNHIYYIRLQSTEKLFCWWKLRAYFCWSYQFSNYMYFDYHASRLHRITHSARLSSSDNTFFSVCFFSTIEKTCSLYNSSLVRFAKVRWLDINFDCELFSLFSVRATNCHITTINCIAQFAFYLSLFLSPLLFLFLPLFFCINDERNQK